MSTFIEGKTTMNKIEAKLDTEEVSNEVFICTERVPTDEEVKAILDAKEEAKEAALMASIEAEHEATVALVQNLIKPKGRDYTDRNNGHKAQQKKEWAAYTKEHPYWLDCYSDDDLPLCPEPCYGEEPYGVDEECVRTRYQTCW